MHWRSCALHPFALHCGVELTSVHHCWVDTGVNLTGQPFNVMIIGSGYVQCTLYTAMHGENGDDGGLDDESSPLALLSSWSSSLSVISSIFGTSNIWEKQSNSSYRNSRNYLTIAPFHG